MESIFSGKVREVYPVDENTLLIVTTDRISAFDVIMPTPIDGKGIILNKLSEFWFTMTSDIIPNHMITTDITKYPEPFRNDITLEGRSMLVKRLRMFPVECIVSGYLTGSNYKNYLKTGHVCGEPLSEGLVESQKLDLPIFCPSTKAEFGEHDEYITFDDVVTLVGTENANILRERSIAMYSHCADYAMKKGVIIADTKFEFGLDDDGQIVLADEVLTPDSSRFWNASEYTPGMPQKSFDKQYLRDWLTSQGVAGVTPPPELPEDVVAKTAEKYSKAYNMVVLN